jgi:hypothetical protein
LAHISRNSEPTKYDEDRFWSFPVLPLKKLRTILNTLRKWLLPLLNEIAILIDQVSNAPMCIMWVQLMMTNESQIGRQ